MFQVNTVNRAKNKFLVSARNPNPDRTSVASINGRASPSRDVKGGLWIRARLASTRRPPSKKDNNAIEMLVRNSRKAWSVSGNFNHFADRPRFSESPNDPNFVDRDYRIISELSSKFGKKRNGVHTHCNMVIGPTHKDEHIEKAIERRKAMRRSQRKARREQTVSRRESEKVWRLPGQSFSAGKTSTTTSQPRRFTAPPTSGPTTNQFLTPKQLKPPVKTYKSKLLKCHWKSNHAIWNYWITIMMPGWSFGVLWDRFYPGKGLIFGLFFQCILSFTIFQCLKSSLADSDTWDKWYTTAKDFWQAKDEHHPDSENITEIAGVHPATNDLSTPKLAIENKNYIDLHKYEITDHDIKTHIEIVLSAGILIYLLFLVRLRVNEERKIKSSNLNSCCVANFCGYCYLIQAANEYDYELINCCDQVVNVDECESD